MRTIRLLLRLKYDLILFSSIDNSYLTLFPKKSNLVGQAIERSSSSLVSCLYRHDIQSSICLLLFCYVFTLVSHLGTRLVHRPRKKKNGMYTS